MAILIFGIYIYMYFCHIVIEMAHISGSRAVQNPLLLTVGLELDLGGGFERPCTRLN